MNGVPAISIGTCDRSLRPAMWMRSFASMLPHGNSRCSEPPCAAKLHSASVGRRPPSQMQNAISTCHGMQLTAFESSADFVFSARMAGFFEFACLIFDSRSDVHHVSVPKSSMLPPSTQPCGAEHRVDLGAARREHLRSTPHASRCSRPWDARRRRPSAPRRAGCRWSPRRTRGSDPPSPRTRRAGTD